MPRDLDENPGSFFARDWIQATFESVFPKLLLLSILCLPCGGATLAISAKLVSNEKYNLPQLVQITIQNNSQSSIQIYKPQDTFLFLWDVEVDYGFGAPKRFSKRIAWSWHESEPVKLDGHDVFADTISVSSPSDFYSDENKKNGCNPFRLAKRMRFIYTFPGHKYPSGNLKGILIEEDLPLKYQTISGTYVTNWVEIDKTDSKKFEQDSTAATKIEDSLEKWKVQEWLPQFDCSSKNKIPLLSE